MRTILFIILDISSNVGPRFAGGKKEEAAVAEITKPRRQNSSMIPTGRTNTS